MKINYNTTRQKFDLCAYGTESYSCWTDGWVLPIPYMVDLGDTLHNLTQDILSDVVYNIPLIEDRHGKTDEEIEQDLIDDSVYLSDYLYEFISANMEDGEDEDDV